MASQRTISAFQIFIGVVVLLLAAATVAQTSYFQGQLNEQNSCIAEAFQEQNNALQARSVPVQRESALTKNAMLAFSEAAEHPQADHQKALIAMLLKYKQDIGKVQKQKARHPIPDYPEGICQ